MLYEDIQDPEKFAMTNALSLSALISLLIKKGIIREEEGFDLEGSLRVKILQAKKKEGD